MKPSLASNRWSPFNGRALLRFLAGFLVLLGFLWLGQAAHDRSHLPLPGPVIGLALTAAVLVTLELRAGAALKALRSQSAVGERSARKALRYGESALAILAAPARLLISHLGLLFIPAGVGIMTQSQLLRTQWLPIVAALLGSTWVGIAVTGWVMQRLAPAP